MEKIRKYDEKIASVTPPPPPVHRTAFAVQCLVLTKISSMLWICLSPRSHTYVMTISMGSVSRRKKRYRLTSKKKSQGDKTNLWSCYLHIGIPCTGRATSLYCYGSEGAVSISCTLQLRHNGHDSVSNHQPHHCLLNRLFGHRSKKT